MLLGSSWGPSVHPVPNLWSQQEASGPNKRPRDDTMLLVLIAHNGKSYELEANAETKVIKVQTALENLTSVPLDQQILTLEGTKLDRDKTFGDYGVGEEKLAEGVKVFFYNKHLLHPASLPPKPEVLPKLKITFPEAEQYQPLHYPFQQSAVSALRNLPKYERQFCFHLARSKAHIEASTEYLRICERLLAEQEVQALAIDSAQVRKQRVKSWNQTNKSFIHSTPLPSPRPLSL